MRDKRENLGFLGIWRVQPKPGASGEAESQNSEWIELQIPGKSNNSSAPGALGEDGSSGARGKSGKSQIFWEMRAGNRPKFPVFPSFSHQNPAPKNPQPEVE